MTTTHQTKGLGGLIFSSPNPDRLAEFYKSVIGLPLEFRSHGGPKHWECDFGSIHFAILPQREKDGNTGTIVPSFVVDDIEKFVAAHDLELSQPIMDLGEGSLIAGIKDIDGNLIRLWMNTHISQR